MSGSDKMEVDDGSPPVVVVDQGQDAKTPGSEEKKKWVLNALRSWDGSLVLSRSGSPVRAPAPLRCVGVSALSSNAWRMGHRRDRRARILVDPMYTYPNIYCTPPIPIHKKSNKKFAAHRQHNATSARHITQLFQLGRLGVRSHNFCEVVTSGAGVA